METIARGVHERVAGDRIVEAWFGSYREPFKSSPARQAKGLEGKILRSIHRTGKHIVCELASDSHQPVDSQWIVHLGMTGRLLVTTPDAPIEPHTHARLRLKSGKESASSIRGALAGLSFAIWPASRPLLPPGLSR